MDRELLGSSIVVCYIIVAVVCALQMVDVVRWLGKVMRVRPDAASLQNKVVIQCNVTTADQVNG